MATDFSLEIATTLSPEQIGDLILRLDGFQPDSEDKRYFWAGGLTGGVRPLDEISQEILQEEVGISADKRIWYRLDTSEYEKGMRNGLRAFIAILREIDGDAVARLNGDDIKLLRKNGKLILSPTAFTNEEGAVWRYEDVPFSDYEIKKIDLIG